MSGISNPAAATVWNCYQKDKISSSIGELSAPYQAVPGMPYILAVAISDEGSLFGADDYDELTLLSIDPPIIDLGTLTIPSLQLAGVNASVIQFIAGSAARQTVQVETPTNNDTMMLALSFDTGVFYYRHTNNGGNSNGLYKVWELNSRTPCPYCGCTPHKPPCDGTGGGGGF